MRGRMDDKKSYAPPLQIGDVMTGESVAEVIRSNIPDFSIGDLVLANTGWQTHYLSNGKGLQKIRSQIAPRSQRDLASWECRALLLIVGFIIIGQPKAGETVVVAAASGRCRVISGATCKTRWCKGCWNSGRFRKM